MRTVTIPAREMRVGDRVHLADSSTVVIGSIFESTDANASAGVEASTIWVIVGPKGRSYYVADHGPLKVDLFENDETAG